MKKTVIVNINGLIFHIDEDAYGKLSAYLDALHRYFDQQTEGKEIVMDIESRIAELLQPLISEAKQSITIEDIENIIATLGKPEDIAGDENQPAEQKSGRQEQPIQKRYSRRLYRDVENSILGGVCSGIAAYFDVDPILIRIIFIALLFAGGVSMIIYLILWIAVPAAITTTQKLEMRGERITVNNIERTYHSTEQTDPHSVWERIRDFIGDVLRLFGKALHLTWRIIVFLTGAFFIFISVVMIICLIGAVFFDKFHFIDVAGNAPLSAREILNSIISPADATTLLIVMVFVIIIPLVGLIYAGLKMVVRFKANDKWPMLSMLLLWIIMVIAGTMLVFAQVNHFKFKGTEKELISITGNKSNIIVLSTPAAPGNDDLYKSDFPSPGLFGIKTRNNKLNLWGVNRIDIEKSAKSYPELEIIKEGRGINQQEATEAAKQIKTSFSQTDSALIIDPLFWISQDKWKFQKVEMIIHLPVGAKIYLDPNLARSLNYTPNADDYWNMQMTGKTWQMTENGLELMKNSSIETHDIKKPSNGLLYIQMRDHYSISRDQLEYHNFGHLNYEGQSFNFRPIILLFKKSEANTASLQIEKREPWIAGNKPIDQSIMYSFEIKDSVLWLDPVFLIPQNEKQNDQDVDLTLYLPVDYKISLGEEMRPLVQKYAESKSINGDDLVQKTWEMTFDGLKQIDEKKDTNN